LVSSNFERPEKAAPSFVFDVRSSVGVLHEQEFSSEAVQLGIVPMLAIPFGYSDPFRHSGESFRHPPGSATPVAERRKEQGQKKFRTAGSERNNALLQLPNALFHSIQFD